MPDLPRFSPNPPNKKEARFRGPLSVSAGRLLTVMAMAVNGPARTARREPDRLQIDVGDPGRDIQSGLALHADRLQRVGIRRAADQKVAAKADADGSVGADAAVIAREIAAPTRAGRRIHRPGTPGLIGEAEINTIAPDGCDIGLGTAAFALEHA